MVSNLKDKKKLCSCFVMIGYSLDVFPKYKTPNLQINTKLALDCMYPLGDLSIVPCSPESSQLQFSYIYDFIGSINALTIAWPIAPWPISDPCHCTLLHVIVPHILRSSIWALEGQR